MIARTFAAVLLATAAFSPASAQTLRPDQTAFRALYQELVETNTTLSVGSCTDAAAKMGARLKAAGFTDSEITYFLTSEHPKDGGLVAVLKGTDARIKPMLLLAHIDVVEAKREDWTRDPFKLIEENGFFYARGAADDKSMAAIWTDAMVRFRQEGYKPKRTIKLALTCGEETSYAFNGAAWLAQNRPELIAAEFALNEGGGGELDPSGKKMSLAMQVGEKAVQNYRIEATNPGGHSSRPVPDNAIYELADALRAVRMYEFPAKFTDTTRAYFSQTAKNVGGQMGGAITALLANPTDTAANKIVSTDPTYHSTLRTTCVATLLDGGHANNALPQRAGANINCRIFPGETNETTRAALVTAINDPKINLTMTPPIRPIAKPPALDAKIVGPATAVAEKHFPGVPILPLMSTGATDGIFLEAIGIPVYGVPGIFGESDFNGIHGLNERMRVSSLYEGRDYLFDLVKVYASK
ncbi:M20/M25/M40 family metallo-hydrolase [Sphingomonas paeninsulae]|jgi:acetylornithine deacetylase/succinyl-diaminopimelate desuccinylase-like protein|uniref:M20/M25/M40 family metallo-hydrolase n=1 Tax=Sphingomonas paeninsulae TaxID=2319844 RepID=A0A494TEA2_SPHPE|nr:M20/M25/M40 family metallo-hydrolase [Sphingomonas paeninsulae]AYJ87600.1 M20/M25/M40 family metallo-hydrolase [Sphingomonas paeninsulae]